MEQEPTFNWHLACRLLESHQYEQVAEFLQKLQVTSEQRNEVILADILAAAYHICLACSQCRAEKRWLRQAHEEADRGEQELRQELYDIFDLLSKGETSEAWTQRTGLPAIPTAEPKSMVRNDPDPEKGLGLLERIKRLLKWRLSPFLSHGQRDPLSGNDALTLPATTNGARLFVFPLLTAKARKPSSPSLAVHCLGPFLVYQDDQPVENWPSSKGKSIFKYMVTHRERPVAKEVLMELFWPYAHPDAARNNLNVAIYGLRQALHDIRPDYSHILFQDDCYLLNPELQIWVDVEAFREHLIMAQSLERRIGLASAVREYRAAEALYKGELLIEDRYEDWPMLLRQSLKADYLNLLDCLSRYYLDQQEYDSCATMCDKMLAIDPCREEAHRRLMRCYIRRGQRYLALRQYQLCLETLQEELDVSPTSATTALYEQIRQG